LQWLWFFWQLFYVAPKWLQFLFFSICNYNFGFQGANYIFEKEFSRPFQLYIKRPKIMRIANKKRNIWSCFGTIHNHGQKNHCCNRVQIDYNFFTKFSCNVSLVRRNLSISKSWERIKGPTWRTRVHHKWKWGMHYYTSGQYNTTFNSWKTFFFFLYYTLFFETFTMNINWMNYIFSEHSSST